MRGVITGKDLFRHSLTIVRLYGARCYLRCLRALDELEADHVPRGGVHDRLDASAASPRHRRPERVYWVPLSHTGDDALALG